MLRRTLLSAVGAAAAMLALSGAAMAQDTVKIGLILPMTGPFASTGSQIEAAAKLYMQQNGDTVAGKKIQLIVKDDTGVADITKRLAQELIVNDKVAVMAGFGLTPLALAAAPLATQAKVPEVVMAAATSIITERSPYIVRTSFTLPQATVPMADWAAQERHQEGRHARFRLRPGHRRREGVHGAPSPRPAGGARTCACRSRTRTSRPSCRRWPTPSPMRCSCSCLRASAAQFMKQFVERGLDKTGIKLIGPGDVTDDDLLNDMGDVALGAITAHHYSAAHDSPENKAFVEAFKKANNGMRPNFMAVGGYDGMHLIYEALKKTNGRRRRQALVDAMKGMSWTSPRGPVSIDPADPRHRAEHLCPQGREGKDGELYNVEFATIPNVKDPVKAAKSN